MEGYKYFSKRVMTLMVLVASVFVSACDNSVATPESLSSARAKFKTEIVDTSFQGDGEPATPPQISFPS